MAEVTNVNTPSDKYLALEKKRVVPRDVYEGLDALREPAKARIYLPRNPTESVEVVPGFGLVDAWQNRVDMSRLKNMFRDAVDDCVGRAFAKEARYDESTPKDLIELMDDVDGRGTNFHVFGMNVAGTSCAEGIDFVLVDFPNTSAASGMTQEQWDRQRFAPFWRRYSPKDVIGWTFRKFGKEERLASVRLRERVYERQVADNPWILACVEQVRVLYCGNPNAMEGDPTRWARWEVWRAADSEKPDGDWVIYDMGLLEPQVEIPIVDFPFMLSAPFEAKPPFLDLAHLTIAHYRKMSALDNAQHVAGFPLLHWAGGQIDPETKRPIGIGPQRMLVSSDPQAKVEFVEPDGTSWASIRVELDAMESTGREMAQEPILTQASGNLTATGEAIRAARSSSRLEAAVLGWQDSFNHLFYFTAVYMGKVQPDAGAGWGGVELNRRFVPISRNIEGVGKALEMHARGRLSDETLFEVAQAAEVVPETVTFEEEEQRISASGPSMTELDRQAAQLELAAAAAAGKDPNADPNEEDDPADDEVPS